MQKLCQTPGSGTTRLAPRRHTTSNGWLSPDQKSDATLARKTKLSKVVRRPEASRGRADRRFRLTPTGRGRNWARILDSTDSPGAVKGGFSTCENLLFPRAQETRFRGKRRQIR